MTPFYIGNFTKGQKQCFNNRIIINAVLITLIIFSAFIYLIEVNSISAFSFKIDTLKQRVRELESDNQQLEIQVGKLESMSNLELWAEELSLVKVAQADYLIPPVTAVAVK